MSSMQDADVGQQLADLDARLPTLLELEGRGQQIAGLGADELGHFEGNGWPLRSQLRLRIEKIDMRGSARHEQENHPLGPGRVMRRPHGERLRCSIRILRNRCRCFGGQQIGQSEQTEAVAGAANIARRDNCTGDGMAFPLVRHSQIEGFHGCGSSSDSRQCRRDSSKPSFNSSMGQPPRSSSGDNGLEPPCAGLYWFSLNRKIARFGLAGKERDLCTLS